MTDNLESGELLLSQKAALEILTQTAFRSFEKTPRKKARAVLNLLFGEAKANGYGGESSLKHHFSGPVKNLDKEKKLVSDLSFYLSAGSINVAMSYVGGA